MVIFHDHISVPRRVAPFSIWLSLGRASKYFLNFHLEIGDKEPTLFQMSSNHHPALFFGAQDRPPKIVPKKFSKNARGEVIRSDSDLFEEDMKNEDQNC